MKIRNKVLIVISAFVFLFVFCYSLSVQAQGIKDAFKPDTGPMKDVTANTGYDPSISAEKYIANIIKVVLSILGVLFLALMIYGGFLWMTANGQETRVTKAKDLITAAIIGVIIVVSAYTIAYFVIEKTTGAVLKSDEARLPAYGD